MLILSFILSFIHKFIHSLGPFLSLIDSLFHPLPLFFLSPLLFPAPSEMASSIRTESLSSRSIRVHWIVSSTVVSTASSSPSDPSYALHTSSPSSNSASQLIKRTFDGFYVGYREIEQLTSASPSSSVLVLSSTASKSPQSVYSFKTVDLSGPAVHQGTSSSSSSSSSSASSSSSSSSSSGSHLIKNDFQYTLTDLKRNTRYGIIVQAFNRKGPGPSSEEVVAITAEYGKCIKSDINTLSTPLRPTMALFCPDCGFILFFLLLLLLLCLLQQHTHVSLSYKGHLAYRDKVPIRVTAQCIKHASVDTGQGQGGCHSH